MFDERAIGQQFRMKSLMNRKTFSSFSSYISVSSLEEMIWHGYGNGSWTISSGNWRKKMFSFKMKWWSNESQLDSGNSTFQLQ